MNRYLMFLLVFLLGVLIYILINGNNFSVGVNSLDDDSECSFTKTKRDDNLFRYDFFECSLSQISTSLSESVINTIGDLHLESCSLTTFPDLSKFAKLDTLKLYNMNLQSIQNKLPSSLTELYLQDCSLTTFPDLSKFANLYLLKLNNINLQSIDIQKLPSSLSILELQISSLTEIPDLSNLTQLDALYLYDMSLNNYDFNKSNVNASLSDLHLENCSLTEIPNLLKFANLSTLSITNNILQSFINIPSTLSDLYLQNCSLTEIPNLFKLPNLSTLILNNNNLQSIEIQNLPSSLSKLYLLDNPLISMPDFHNFKNKFKNELTIYYDKAFISEPISVDVCKSITDNITIYSNYNKDNIINTSNCLNIFNEQCENGKKKPECIKNIDDGHVGYCFNYQQKTCNNKKTDKECSGSKTIWCPSSDAIELRDNIQKLKNLLSDDIFNLGLYDFFKKLNPHIGKLLKHENEKHPIIFNGITEMIIELGIEKLERDSINKLMENNNSDEEEQLIDKIIKNISDNPHLIKYINSTEDVNLCYIINIMKNNIILYELIKYMIIHSAMLDLSIFERIRNFECMNETDSNKCNTHDMSKLIIIFATFVIIDHSLDKGIFNNDEINQVCEEISKEKCESCPVVKTMRTLCDEFLNIKP